MHSSLPSFVACQPNGSLLLSLLDFVVFVVVRSLSNFVVPVVDLGDVPCTIHFFLLQIRFCSL